MKLRNLVKLQKEIKLRIYKITKVYFFLNNSQIRIFNSILFFKILNLSLKRKTDNEKSTHHIRPPCFS